MKKLSIEIKWALIFVIAGLLWIFLERLVGLHTVNIDKHPYYTNLFAIIAVVIYTLALLDKRRNYYGGKMTYKQGFISGLWITLFVTILTPLTQWINHEIITPHYFENAIEYSVESELMTREEAEDYFNMKNYIIQSLIFAPIVGFVTSGIIAFFTKNTNVAEPPTDKYANP
ncbi:DUF4199 domain-containing protein [Mangrovivirga sp. M17]|uniref:DUF4199 domain-containing protein n=1 Tax=Mangrovivirga halotolerans TaxID=2993936 RepID=A0ABT3RPJ8_9BACT|nr:DUF4199 domain-containing protein [Mangrovivirga halotolerans]MCX2743289.1 DUF4199 domain-containing protein [Mangrovivirga halotolerans]